MHFRGPEGLGVILGDGSSTQVIRLQGEAVTRTTVALPASYNDVATFAVPINESPRVFVGVHFLNHTGLTTFSTAIEFLDPDWSVGDLGTSIWTPSKGEGADLQEDRGQALASKVWTVTPATGASYVFSSDEEHRHYSMFRVRFQGATVGASTKVLVNWWHSGGKSPGKMYG